VKNTYKNEIICQPSRGWFFIRNFVTKGGEK
jgi:hypothetical protein